MSQSVFFYEPFYELDRVFDAFTSPFFNGGQGRRALENENGAIRAIKPRMDLREDVANNKVTATLELPGLKKEDVNIDLSGGRITISAENKSSDEYEKNGYAIRERRFGKMSRTLQLPQGVKEEDIQASMVDGVLTVTFPKTAAEMAPKKITVA